ncbi:MAG: recombination regulator RecX [Candidatus Omnitrophica bacterium]|nr:recombination regulator RecX [Candidatus Omnitrophota bacterium]MBU1047452.1 recombination regulator RecX [Candidatus Omnitrophota bacterium]MBU1631448.1 recombination regulator RecX [Candidatus Omnitrophota bacterium]MBU1766861.1 recombination regulator RecX [Candidatus Omnitrophota bacterium]MBU1888815.1 recombination regulator RecX [Candidatus Omnitrophota bacterium]
MQEKIEKAKAAALRLLSYRMRSCKEISDKLQDKGFTQNIIQAVIQDLKRINYLNDYEFAKAFIESRLIHNPKGKTLLLYELLKKGVDKDTVNKVLDEIISREKEENIVKVLAQKLWQKKRNLDKAKRKAQTYNYLARRGFPASLIIKILEELGN